MGVVWGTRRCWSHERREQEVRQESNHEGRVLKVRPQRWPRVTVKLFIGHPNPLTIIAFLHLKMSYVYGATPPLTGAWL